MAWGATWSARLDTCCCRFPDEGAKMRLLAVLLMARMLVNVEGVLHHCPIAEVEDCLRPLDPLTTYHRTILPSYDTTTLANVCRSFHQMEHCLAPLKVPCSQSQQGIFTGVTRARDFLCGHGLKEYGEHKVCFAKDALAAEGRACNMTTAPGEHGQSHASSSPIRDKRSAYSNLCRDASRFMKCVREAVMRHCGGGAALWVENVNSNVFSPLIGSSGCFHKDHSVGITLIFAITISVIVTIFILITTFIICQRCKRLKKSANHSSLSMLAMSLEEQNNTTSDDNGRNGSEIQLLYSSNDNSRTNSNTVPDYLWESPYCQYGCHHQHSDDIAKGYIEPVARDSGSSCRLGRVVVGSEDETSREEEVEVDYSSPQFWKAKRARHLKGFLSPRKEYYLLTAGDGDLGVEEEVDGEEDRETSTCKLLPVEYKTDEDNKQNVKRPSTSTTTT